MNNRKGQFFIISAVVILLALYGMRADLDLKWDTDISDNPLSDVKTTLLNIENGIYATIATSPAEELEENLNKFAISEKNSLNGKYILDISYNITSANVVANITLDSKEVYVEKLMFFAR